VSAKYTPYLVGASAAGGERDGGEHRSGLRCRSSRWRDRAEERSGWGREEKPMREGGLEMAPAREETAVCG
jgi:hypothetical protein